MLPGFRFLVAATVLTVSLVIFGLGAAALLRASHERFASLPARPAPSPLVTPTMEAVPTTLAILRTEPAPVEAAAPAAMDQPIDTLLPTDRLAATITESRSEDIVAPPAAEASKPETEAAPAPSPQAAAEPVVLPQGSAPIQAVATSNIEKTAGLEPPAAPSGPAARQVAAMPEPEITGSLSEPAMPDPPLVNAKPIRRPPLPTGRPAAADIVAALPIVNTARPAGRQRNPVIKRAVKKPRSVARPRPARPAAVRPDPAAPFGATGFGASPFGT